MALYEKTAGNGWTATRLGNLDGRTYVITGTTSGTGLQAAKMLLAKGARVVMLNRSEARSRAVEAQLRQACGEQAEVLSVCMDLGNLASVRTAAKEVLARVDRIDALICNAAIAQVDRLQKTVDGFESQLGVNHFGHFLLCGLLFERIQTSQGRIVIVGSLGYRMGLKRIQFEDLNFERNYSGWNAYSQSKLAQMMFGYELQRRLAAAGSSVQVLVCHPGATRTGLIREHSGWMKRLLFAAMAPFIAQSAEQGAWPEV
ncbi:MAG: SDR family oxidoreductase, partial [Gammaproteobacteria bacterium]